MRPRRRDIEDTREGEWLQVFPTLSTAEKKDGMHFCVRAQAKNLHQPKSPCGHLYGCILHIRYLVAVLVRSRPRLHSPSGPLNVGAQYTEHSLGRGRAIYAGCMPLRVHMCSLPTKAALYFCGTSFFRSSSGASGYHRGNTIKNLCCKVE